MILTRTPFRISFAGGGTDLESCYSVQGGAVLATAINHYMYLAVKDHFGGRFRVSYSRTEYAERADQLQHPIVRVCLQNLGIGRPLEIVSMADLPAQAGMGSSSSFTVGLLHALYSWQGCVVSAARLAEEACRIEIDQLGEPIGKQDQYIAAYGGLKYMRFHRDGSVSVEPVLCRAERRRQLNDRLLIFFVGGERQAREVLTEQSQNAAAHLPVLARMSGVASQMRDILANDADLIEFGRLLHEGWELKKQLNHRISNSRIDEIYQAGLESGGVGGKLLGAGSGGFLLLYCEPEHQRTLRQRLASLPEVRFSLEPEGTKIVHLEDSAK